MGRWSYGVMGVLGWWIYGLMELWGDGGVYGAVELWGDGFMG